jgi:histidinol phosphatase-like PHP family hydrolase
VTNSRLAELLAAEAENHADHRARALRRAAHRALLWPEEAERILAAGRPLTELPAVGPWVAGMIEGWIDNPPAASTEVPPSNRGFISMAEALRALEAAPEYRLGKADLQVHTTWSDGEEPLEVMASELAARGYAYAAITDHSQGLKIANGMDERTLETQWPEIEAASESRDIELLKGLEMNLSPEGEGDMDPAVLAKLDLVLGAFHSQLRVKEDQTDRYLAALANPTVDVLAHPVARMYNRRPGLTADWPRVFAAAAERGVALEIDCTVARQDLPVDLLKVARDSGAWFSMGTDAHGIAELDFMPLGLGAAAMAGISPDRILTFRPAEEVRGWVRERRARAAAGS